MKLEINMPDVEKGTELQVMHVGTVKQGDTVELTDAQIANFRDAGYELSESGTMKLYQESSPPEEDETQTTNLPGIEEVAERARKRTSSAPEKTVDEVLKSVGDAPDKAQEALATEKSRGQKARPTLVSQLEKIVEGDK